MTRESKITVFLGLSAVVIVGTFLLPRIPQPQSYHAFADYRPLAGIPNFGDVISNLGFLACGIYGLVVTWRRRRFFHDAREAVAYIVLFAGLLLTAFGSAYYHLDPNNERLVWDRLPMTVGFMGLFAALICERISVRAGVRLLPLLMAVGASSVVYWIWSEHQGHGDLRPYVLVQFYPLLAILLLLWLFPPRYTRGYDYLIALGFYSFAKAFESADEAIFNLTRHGISGHTLKHIAAGLGGYWLARMLGKRLRIDSYSYLSASTGSSREARRAGI